jgi:hypothetical protein
VTADALLLDSSLLEELDPLEDSLLLVEVSFAEDVLALRVLADAARLASATSAGSCPEASCTYTVPNAAMKVATAKHATERRIRRARRRIASRWVRASARALSCSAVRGSDARREGLSLDFMVTPIELLNYV